MVHESNEDILTIESSSVTFEEILKKPYIPQAYLEEIKAANLLIIPNENVRDGVDICFPETTDKFFMYIKNNSNGDVVADIAVDDDDFIKLELHSAVITVATCIVKVVVWPVVAGIISSFIYDQVKKHHRSEDDMQAEVNIIVEKDGQSKRVTYKGPASKVRAVLNTAENLFDESEV